MIKLTILDRLFIPLTIIFVMISLPIMSVSGHPSIQKNSMDLTKEEKPLTSEMEIIRIPQAGSGIEYPQIYTIPLSEEPMKRIALSPSQYQILSSKPKPTQSNKILIKKTDMKNTPKKTSLKNTQKHIISGETPPNNLLYSLVQAEAGNQDLKGCRLVADVVLNRVDDPRFPSTIEEVVYAPGQFSVVRNGALKKSQGEISEKVVQAVDMELNSDRLDTDILYFNNSNNGGWKYGGHWFK